MPMAYNNYNMAAECIKYKFQFSKVNNYNIIAIQNKNIILFPIV